MLGTAAFALGAPARRAAIINIRPVVGAAQSLQTVRRMFVHNSQYYLSLFSRRPKRVKLEDHQLDGWQHFREALSGGRGCVLVSPHLGDINYYAELFLAAGYPVNVVVEQLEPPALSDLMVRLRGRREVGIIVGGPGALRQIYRALDRNEIVAIISDRDLRGDGLPVRFFGRQARMPGLAFAIAARRGVPVVFGTAVRLRPNHVVSDVRPPFVPTANTQLHVQQMADVFEQFIRRFPDQWLAFQPIFDVTAALGQPRVERQEQEATREKNPKPPAETSRVDNRLTLSAERTVSGG